jgi:hypothetical protein
MEMNLGFGGEENEIMENIKKRELRPRLQQKMFIAAK